ERVVALWGFLNRPVTRAEGRAGRPGREGFLRDIHRLSPPQASRMRMIESMDSAVSRPSEELWAEICSCLPRPEQMDPGDAFTDSFVAPCAPGSGSGGSAPANPKPWAPLSDSEVYLASLERRLMRIKGLSQEVTSKDMLRTLAQARQECWDRFLQEKFESECYVEGHDSEERTRGGARSTHRGFC
ncbi:hypothetical protein A306_00012025, partial [Columba livia]